MTNGSRSSYVWNKSGVEAAASGNISGKIRQRDAWHGEPSRNISSNGDESAPEWQGVSHGVSPPDVSLDGGDNVPGQQATLRATPC